ncbi:hypothetical protein, partial [Yaniella sp.]|uniref:hypothetical protein n=1 Tax=Yaniella sp. TaxID=2773929 RepID=UPI003F9A233A
HHCIPGGSFVCVGDDGWELRFHDLQNRPKELHRLLERDGAGQIRRCVAKDRQQNTVYGSLDCFFAVLKPISKCTQTLLSDFAKAGPFARREFSKPRQRRIELV